jgi:hypothetical protein
MTVCCPDWIVCIRLYLLMMGLDTPETCRSWRNVLRISCASIWFFFTRLYRDARSTKQRKIHVYFQNTEINNDNILKEFNKQHSEGIHEGIEYFKKYKAKGRSQKCLNDKNRQFVPTVETADKYSSKCSSKNNHLKLKIRVLKLRVTVSKSTQENNRLKFLLCLNLEHESKLLGTHWVHFPV